MISHHCHNEPHFQMCLHPGQLHPPPPPPCIHQPRPHYNVIFYQPGPIQCVSEWSGLSTAGEAISMCHVAMLIPTWLPTHTHSQPYPDTCHQQQPVHAKPHTTIHFIMPHGQQQLPSSSARQADDHVYWTTIQQPPETPATEACPFSSTISPLHQRQPPTTISQPGDRKVSCVHSTINGKVIQTQSLTTVTACLSKYVSVASSASKYRTAPHTVTTSIFFLHCLARLPATTPSSPSCLTNSMFETHASTYFQEPCQCQYKPAPAPSHQSSHYSVAVAPCSVPCSHPPVGTQTPLRHKPAHARHQSGKLSP